jgi:[ribosomal protein S18]-alanine N-acetyltransferase
MHRTISIRPFHLSDMDCILQIEHACFSYDAYDRNLFAEYFRKCGDFFLVAERAGRILGYMVSCTRFREGSLRAQLISVAVDPEARRLGAASALLESTLRRLRRRGVSRITLMVKITNEPALEFYRRRGFWQLRILRSYYEDGQDAWLMARDLR